MPREKLELLVDRIATPTGEMVLMADREGNLRMIEWPDQGSRLQRQLDRQFGKGMVTLTPTRDPGGLSGAMRRYFKGDLSAIEKLPVKAEGTPFQESVWAALREIECGTTISYAELARRIGRPKAVRAVGLANGQNPVGVVVPCHRVIGSNGSLTGYGGGLPRKKWLLEHEGVAP
jgi:methylated-DNA-[protein]-cysteine S-methyltransferase